MDRIVVVGAGPAGAAAALELRRRGSDATIRLVGDEAVRPYERPPLSKSLLAGHQEPDDLVLHAAEEADVEWMLGERVEGLDLDGRQVVLATGHTVPFDGLVIATGARPRTLADQPQLAGLHVLRTVDDAMSVRADLDAGPERVAVVGAGFIGAEVAATARSRGVAVTMIDPLESPMVGALGAAVGEHLARLHRDNGVDLRTGVGVDRIAGDDRVEQVVLDDGSVVEADVVVIGIGVVPNTEWLEGSGLAIDDGVVCDATLRAGPGVVAAGDVARWDHPRFGSMRIEHWDNASEMGEAAARRLLSGDEGEVFAPVPWFWSDQYDVKLQLAGRPDPKTDEFHVTHGAVEDNKWIGLYRRGDDVTGVLGWNWPARVARLRLAMEDGLRWEDAVEGGG